MPYLFSAPGPTTTTCESQRQLEMCMKFKHCCCSALAAAPVGNAQRFPAARPREADFLWEGGRDPLETPAGVFHGRAHAFHGKSAPEHGPTQGGGPGGDQAVVDSVSIGMRALAASAR